MNGNEDSKPFLLRLDSDVKEWLRVEAFKTRKSQSDLIREALVLYKRKRGGKNGS